MNVPLIILWTIVCITSVLLLVTVSLYAYKIRKDLEYEVVEVLQPCKIDYANMVNVENKPCCVVGTNITASKYSPELDLVVNPVEAPYLPVCAGFCSEGVLADGMTCVNGVGQNSFDRCIAISTPKNCEGLAMPVAYSGTTAYYPYSATQDACLKTAMC